MQFVSRLIEISDRVAEAIRKRGELLVSQLHPFPTDLASSTAASDYRKLVNAKTQVVAIESTCSISAEEVSERVSLEAALAQANPAELHAKTEAQLNRLAELKVTAKSREAAVSNTKAAEIVAARVSAIDKRAAAKAHATSFFQGLPLKGVGEEAWLTMWKAAEAYAIAHAYPELDPPNTGEGARCVLCQQELNSDGKARFMGFFDFVQGRLQAEAVEAQAALEKREAGLLAVPDAQAWAAVSQGIGFETSLSEAMLKALVLRTDAMRKAVDLKDIPDVDWAGWYQAHSVATAALEKQRDTLAALMDVVGRKKNEQRLADLKGKEWLAAQKESIRVEIARLRAGVVISAAVRSASTNELTKKINAIAEAETAKGFCERFEREMELLGGRGLPVVMRHRSEGKGRYKFYAELRGPKQAIRNREILSEGEQRVVALAAFLADATGTDRSLPIVFDDPISSLDQRFEEAVADRIAELSENRQVIVFTHRLSLMVLLKSAVKKRTEFNGSTARFDVLPIARRGPSAGVPSTINAFSMKPRDALDKIMREARSAADQEEEIRQSVLWSACANFRIALERTVEEHLLFGMVIRYRRDIKTMGHLKKLTAIRMEDCELIDSMMSKYSVFVHSQPLDTPVWFPEIDELVDDAGRVLAWIKPFEARADGIARGKVAMT